MKLVFIPSREPLWPEALGLLCLILIAYALFAIFAPLLAKLGAVAVLAPCRIGYFEQIDWAAIRSTFFSWRCRFGFIVALLITVMLALLIGNAT